MAPDLSVRLLGWLSLCAVYGWCRVSWGSAPKLNTGPHSAGCDCLDCEGRIG